MIPYHERRDVPRLGENAEAAVHIISKTFKQNYGVDPTKVLDVGTGYGDFVNEGLKVPWDVYGMDCRGEVFQGPKERFILGDLMGDWPVEDGSIDLVFERLTMDDLVELQGLDFDVVRNHFSEQVSRVLKPGGYFATFGGYHLNGMDVVHLDEMCRLLQKP